MWSTGTRTWRSIKLFKNEYKNEWEKFISVLNINPIKNNQFTYTFKGKKNKMTNNLLQSVINGHFGKIR
jgi:hypothetical protein